MNCPNCGGLLNLKERHCEYCNTTFTEAELSLENKNKSDTNNTEKTPQPERKKSRTEQMQEELKNEKKNNQNNTSDTNDVLTGAAVMGMLGLFPRIRRFFYDLKRTVCMILLVALEAGFGFLMISGKVLELMEGDIQDLVAVNLIIIVNALLAGIISRIGRIRAGTAITAVVNFLAVVWVFAYPLFTTNFAGQTPQSVAIIAVIEMAVLSLSVLLSHLIYRRY